MDLLLSRSASLGESQAHAGSPPWGLVGRQQNWHVASADRNIKGLVDDLSRRAKNAIKLHLSAGSGAVRPSTARQVLDPRGFLDVCARGGVRASWRRPRRRISLRLHLGSGWRHHQSLLWSCRFKYCFGARQHPLSPELAGGQRPFGTQWGSTSQVSSWQDYHNILTPRTDT